MATIPLQLAQRRLDTGNVVSYPAGPPVGEAMQNFGDELSAVAERYRQQKEQQEAFDAEIVRRRLNEQVAQAEDEAVQNAPADGRGLHDSMYGQVDPRTGRVVKPGLFDELFDSTLPKVSEGQRANFTGRRKSCARLAPPAWPPGSRRDATSMSRSSGPRSTISTPARSRKATRTTRRPSKRSGRAASTSSPR
ncbi:hypothetical protein MESS2_670002 [Mesorhizobium metallidurans STM 2683]|uniref:Uncharacterized protein n=1 Tax=Mesorhizobium metallidurans STM 2683 TaxID=1297569 RepID=M5ESS7_9HYPH|nr:hypothetical protein MESS2_670002 [Mesorhizobium metallidurans STM 2683]